MRTTSLLRRLADRLAVAVALLLPAAVLAQPGLPPADPQVGDGGTGAFYQWTAPIPTGAPRIVRSEPMPADKALADAQVSQRVLYSSIGGPDGRRPIIVSGAVYLPRGKAPKGGWPVIAWAHGTVGFPDVCAPSFNGWSDRDREYLNVWLKQGYAVVASDYEGLGVNGPHPYMMSRSEAQGVLDAVVAARRAFPIADRVVIVGQSQGGHAAANAALMQPEIAPRLDVRGTVLTGWPGTMEMPPVKMDDYDPFAVLILRFLPTYAHLDPAFRPYSVLTPAGREVYEGFRTTCGRGAMVAYLAAKPITRTLFSEDPSPLEARAQPYRAYPPLAFKVPVFLGIGLADEQTSPRLAFEHAKRACALGSNIAIHMYPGVSHAGTVLRSQQDSLAWVRDAFAGRVGDGRCGDARFPDEAKP